MMNTKKRLLIVNNNLDTGGIQRALVNLLQELDKKDLFDIELFLFSNTGEYKDDIPESIKVTEGNKLVNMLGISQNATKKIGFFYYLIRGIAVVYTKIISRELPLKLILSTQKMNKDYDYAISYMHDSSQNSFYGGCNNFVLDNVRAKKKITFVHCDYPKYGGNNKINRLIYGKFDLIATVSDSCKINFIMANPELREKVVTVFNCQNFKEIKEKASDNPIVFKKNRFNIVTVARLSAEKGIIRAINAIEKIAGSKSSILWHIVGSGALEPEVKSIIEEKKLGKTIILYGNKNNPYRYMKNADLFLLPSIHEAAPMVFDEAKCLCIPVLTTNTTSAIEMITEFRAGWVCDNSEEGIYKGLEYIIENKNELNKIKKNLSCLNNDNELALKQFLCLFEGEK